VRLVRRTFPLPGGCQLALVAAAAIWMRPRSRSRGARVYPGFGLAIVVRDL